ncbi:hypothetical protein ACFU9Y_01365 [Streptomyces sp. NPDC057621]|uniref:Uncharacterized protein n=1 Tax=Streptomyces liliiviolaceus TaxID=2823109 RepID=A0A940Y587_9ACTN|nr:hypothetical protein [Streptomyces liliiviolaceus]MBQ0853417.1 hypothetical protein [Streptomyces liliiviolaceus]
MPSSDAPKWLRPLHPEVRTLPAGQWWDAVRVPLATGMRILDHLGPRTGAVIEDGYGGVLYWLVPPGEAATWDVPPARILGQGSHVAVPPRHRTYAPGLHWRVPPTRTRHWTDPAHLHAALRRALS